MIAVVVGHRRVVDGRHRQAHLRTAGAAMAVGNGVGETVGAVVVGARRIADAAVLVQRDRAMGGGADGGDGQRVMVGIGVVAQQARRRDMERRVLGSREAVVVGHRGVVDRRDRDAHRRDVAVGGAVVGLVGEAVGAVVV